MPPVVFNIRSGKLESYRQFPDFPISQPTFLVSLMGVMSLPIFPDFIIVIILFIKSRLQVSENLHTKIFTAS